MSNKHLFKFQTESDYKKAKRNHLITPNISKVVETGNTYINSQFASKETAEAGDIIVFHEEENGEKTIAFMKPDAYDKNDNYWTADAIVVVPYSHTNDGTVRAMGLKYASVLTPSEGGDGENILLGRIQHIQNNRKYKDFTLFDAADAQTIEDTVGVGMTGEYNFASDAFEDVENSVLNPFDEEAFYVNEQHQILSSPYNNDGSKNDAFHSTGDFATFTSNPFQDMDGDANTLRALKTLEEEYLADTLYADTLDNEYGKAIPGEQANTETDLFPLYSACARYSSVLKPCVFDSSKSVEENIATMPWYCPSAGEIGYYAARMDKIKFALKQVGFEPNDEETIISNTAALHDNFPNDYCVGFFEGGNFKYYVFEQGYKTFPFCKF